jgi:hypothetical protein
MRASRPGPVPAALLPAVLVGVVVLGGCGDDAGTEPSVVPSTVTVTLEESPGASAEPTAETSAEPTTGATPSASAEPSGDPAALPKQERGYDVVYITDRADTPDGTVLTFDRLTVVGVDDAVLAAEGAPLTVDDGSKFTNQAVRLYEVGVSPEARFFLTTCTAVESGPPSISSQPVDLDRFLEDPSLEGTAVTFEYGDGLLVRAETNPRC